MVEDFDSDSGWSRFIAIGLLPVYTSIPPDLWPVATSDASAENIFWWALILPGLIVVGAAIFRAWSVHRFGVGELTLNPMPVKTGGTLTGRMSIKGLVQDQSVSGSIICMETYFKSGGCTSGRSYDILWSRELNLEQLPGHDFSEFRFRLSLPEELPATGDEREDERTSALRTCRWQIDIEADRIGLLRYKRDYSIPVI